LLCFGKIVYSIIDKKITVMMMMMVCYLIENENEVFKKENMEIK